jgi:mTERF domain-containing protein, mitochondrial
MLASVCRRRGLLLALAPVPISAAAGAATNCHSNPSTVLLSHIYSLTPVAPNSDPCPTTVAYLVSCGVSPATAAIRKVRIRDTDKADAKILLTHLGTLVMPLDRISEASGDLKELGLSVTDTNFLYAIRVMCSLRRETWRRKMELYKCFGVSEVYLIRAFKTQPTILLASEESIKKKVRFFLDVLKLDLISVMQHPMSLSLSLEKCVKPRCAVLSLLARKGKIVRKIKLIAALVTNSRVFSERFVLKYADDVPSVVKAFEGKIKFEGFEDRELEFLQLKWLKLKP